jgi:RNA polymerase sigma factor
VLGVLLFFLAKKDKDKPLEQLAIKIQSGNEEILNAVLHSYQPFIKKTVSSVCKRYISESDDEFSVGLMAFHDALMKFEYKRGNSLLSFSEVIIKRRVIDYIRQNSRHKSISLDLALETDPDEKRLNLEEKTSYEDFLQEEDKIARREEIQLFKERIAEFNLKFEDLIKQSPKHEDARINAFQVAKVIANDMNMWDYMLSKKRIPMKQLVEKVDVSRKTLERNRKFIMVLVIIMKEDFLYLQDYLKGRLT